jgi:hypothetical protein
MKHSLNLEAIATLALVALTLGGCATVAEYGLQPSKINDYCESVGWRHEPTTNPLIMHVQPPQPETVESKVARCIARLRVKHGVAGE